MDRKETINALGSWMARASIISGPPVTYVSWEWQIHILARQYAVAFLEEAGSTARVKARPLAEA